MPTQTIPSFAYRSPCMDKNDRIPWTHGVAYDAGGVDVGLRTTDAEVFNSLLRCVPGYWKKQDKAFVENLYSVRVGPPSQRDRGFKQFNLVYSGWTQIERTLILAEALDSCVRQIIKELEPTSSKYIFIRARIFHRNQQAILVLEKESETDSPFGALLETLGFSASPYRAAILDGDGAVWTFGDIKSAYYDKRPGQTGPHQVAAVILLKSTMRKPKVEMLTPGQGISKIADHVPIMESKPAEALDQLAKLKCRIGRISGDLANSNGQGGLLECVQKIIGGQS